jgi:hypothetical protein
MLLEGAAAQRPAKATGGSGNKALEKAQGIKITPTDYKYDNQEGMGV